MAIRLSFRTVSAFALGVALLVGTPAAAQDYRAAPGAGMAPAVGAGGGLAPSVGGGGGMAPSVGGGGFSAPPVSSGGPMVQGGGGFRPTPGGPPSYGRPPIYQGRQPAYTQRGMRGFPGQYGVDRHGGLRHRHFRRGYGYYVPPAYVYSDNDPSSCVLRRKWIRTPHGLRKVWRRICL